jgi:uncharacterized membrane protein (UPF0136 family)
MHRNAPIQLGTISGRWRGRPDSCAHRAALRAFPGSADGLAADPQRRNFHSDGAPITALLGRNPVLIGGAASAAVLFIAGAVRSQGIGGAAKVTIVASVLMMGFCVPKLGRYAAKVPTSVIAGFPAGIGAIMIISQLDVIFGVAAPHASNSLFELVTALGELSSMRWAPLSLTGGICRRGQSGFLAPRRMQKHSHAQASSRIASRMPVRVRRGCCRPDAWAMRLCSA